MELASYVYSPLQLQFVISFIDVGNNDAQCRMTFIVGFMSGSHVYSKQPQTCYSLFSATAT